MTSSTERTYANTACPYCGAGLTTLPKAKKRCPSCGQPIWVRSGPDGLTYLLQTVDLPTLEAAWAEHLEERDRPIAEAARLEGERVMAENLASYRELGLKVEILTDDESCAECRKFAGHIFDARAVPVLPYARCRHDLCRCDYVPVT